MRVVGIKLLKNKLSEYVKAAASGERVLITDRDRVVAELVPPAIEPGPYANPLLNQMVREGRLTPATDRSGTPPPRHPMMKMAELLSELDADRADR